MAANIEVRHTKDESSMIMDRCGTRSSVVMHKFAKVPWLKLYQDNSVLDSNLRIAAVNTNAMAIEEFDSDEERRSRLRRKKESLNMDDNSEIQGTRRTEDSDARDSRDPVPAPLETSIAQRSAPDLVLWSTEPGGLLEPAQEERKAKGRSVQIGPKPAEKATHELTHARYRNWCNYCLLARAADDPHHRQPHKEPEFPIIMANYCFMQDSPGGELFTILDMLDVALGMMAAISVEEKEPSTYVVSAVVEHLRAWGRKKVIFRIDGEPAIRALGVAIQHARSEETVIECRPKYSSPSMGPVENMNKEQCGLVRCFRIYLREKAKVDITTESPLLPWLVRHCGWILCRYAVRADGRTGYSRLKGREYTAGIAIFGEAIWYKLPKVADLTKLDDRCRTAIWLGKSDRSDEHIIGVDTGAVLARSVRRKAEGKRWSERALKLVTGTPWNPRPGDVVMRRRYITRALVERYGPTKDCGACFRKSQ